ELLAFARRLLQLRREQPVFRRRRFFLGRAIHGEDIKDLYWLKSDGHEMTEDDWNAGHAHCLCMALPGDQIDETGEQGERITGDTFALLFNAHDEAVPFNLGARDRKVAWQVEFDTADPKAADRRFAHSASYPLQGHSLVLLRATLPIPPKP
ncbi:MAG TPA: hypothetical protein VGE67_16945, partial [Haloferula sp.]